jgi:protein SCO1/2
MWQPLLIMIALPTSALLFASTSAAAEAKPIGEVLDQVGISPRLGTKASLDTSFVDHKGRTVRMAELFGHGRPVVLHLVYYECPMLCKLSSDGLLRALSTLSLKPGEDFSIVTLSFDPSEGPELSARARDVAIERYGEDAVKKGWHFLTGDETAIARLCESVGFRYAYDEASRQYAHAAGIFVLTAGGTLSRYLSGVEFPPRDLRLALVEASAGKVGTVTDQVLLMCYMYDPSTGKYGFAIMTTIRAAGIATVGGLAIGIITMLRRERQRAPGTSCF